MHYGIERNRRTLRRTVSGSQGRRAAAIPASHAYCYGDPVETTPASETIHIDGIRLHAEWRGTPQPGRPVLVFLHDGLGSLEALRQFPDRMRDATGLCAFAYDRWGYGRSDERPAFPPDFMEQEAARLPLVLNAAGIADYILIGHSAGAVIALMHAANLSANLSATQPATRPAGMRAAVIISARVFGEQASVDQVEHFLKLARDNEIPEWMVRYHGARARRLMGDWAAAWRGMFERGWDIRATVASIRPPLCVLQGEDDDFGRPVQLDAIARAVPHAESTLLPGCAHFPHLDKPDEVVALVADFVRRHAG